MRVFLQYCLWILLVAPFLACAEEGNVPAVEGKEDAAKANPASTEEIVQKEIDRRREASFRWNEILDLGERLYQGGEWSHAGAKFRLVMAETTGQSFSEGFYRRAQIGAAKCLTAQALAKKEEGNTSEAASLMKQAEEMDPTNMALAKQAVLFSEESALANDIDPMHVGITEDLLAKTAQIKKLLSLADQLTETGQYRKARSKLDDVLRIDPYNRVAKGKIEMLEKKLLEVADVRYRASREKALAMATEAWKDPTPARVNSGRSRAVGTAGSTKVSDVYNSLSEIKIPELIFNEKPIRQAVEELQRLSEQYDPNRRGLNFVLKLPASKDGGSDPEAATVDNVELHDVSLQTAIKYVCEQIKGTDKLRFEVEENAVVLLPVTESGGQLETRSFNVPPSMMASVTKTDPADIGKELLESIGVKADVLGTKAVCFRDTGKLVVRSTPNELVKLEARFQTPSALADEAQRQFQVETKFLQFSENDVKNFTFNLQMSGSSAIPAPGMPGQTFDPGSASGGTDGLRGTAGLNPNGASALALQQLLDPTYPQYASNQIGVNSTVFGKGFAAMLQLLQNAIGRDLVAAPKVILSSGKKSKIVVSREMWYPTSYTQPNVPNNDQGVGAGFILPSNPTSFEKRDIGVTLDVKGNSTSVPTAVDLEFSNLLVEDFEGFVDYGSNIATVSFGQGPATTGSVTVVDPVSVPIGTAPYLVPIFSKRSLQTTVRLLDDETLGMGGLIADSIQKVEDKVPGLGDVPLLGRLFRSEVSQKIKTNLVIFCHLRIIRPNGQPWFQEDEEEDRDEAKKQPAATVTAFP